MTVVEAASGPSHRPGSRSTATRRRRPSPRSARCPATARDSRHCRTTGGRARAPRCPRSPAGSTPAGSASRARSRRESSSTIEPNATNGYFTNVCSRNLIMSCLQGQAGVGGGEVGRRQVRVDGVDDRQAAGRPGGAQFEVTDRGRGQVAGLRVARLPEPGGLPVRGDRLPRRDSVGDRDFAFRHGDLEVVGRLVGRVVADRVPGHRALGFADHHGAVAGGDPAVERVLDVRWPGGLRRRR